MEVWASLRPRESIPSPSRHRPEIELWDLDMLDAVEPTLVLGGVEASEAPPQRAKPKAGKKGKAKKDEEPPPEVFKKDSHTDAVMGLSWNGA